MTTVPFGNVVLDLDTRELRRGGESVLLTLKQSWVPAADL